MKDIETLALEAQTDASSFEVLVKQQEPYILRCASKACRRFVTKNDDEWSIALLAFSEAVKSYEQGKGSFLSLAELVIHRRLIDYIKSQNKYNSEISIDPVLFDAEPEEETEDLGLRAAVAEQVSKQDTGDLKLEIEAANALFSKYSFTFFDLTECSPKSGKTKRACAKAVGYILKHPLLITLLHTTKLLPLKEIEENAKVPRKILERHRKYIIAGVEILSGDFPLLAQYLSYIREEIKE